MPLPTAWLGNLPLAVCRDHVFLKSQDLPTARRAHTKGPALVLLLFCSCMGSGGVGLPLACGPHDVGQHCGDGLDAGVAPVRVHSVGVITGEGHTACLLLLLLLGSQTDLPPDHSSNLAHTHCTTKGSRMSIISRACLMQPGPGGSLGGQQFAELPTEMQVLLWGSCWKQRPSHAPGGLLGVSTARTPRSQALLKGCMASG